MVIQEIVLRLSKLSRYIVSLSNKVGESNDTGGTITSGSMMAKNNAILNSVSGLETNLGRLDTTVSSRAPSSTALSTSTWTSTRASYLDYLANGTYGLSAIKALLNTINSNTSGGSSIIKSIQRGIFYAEGSNLTTTIPITAVNPSKCFIVLDCGSQYETKYGGVYLDSLTATSIIVKRAVNINHSCSWQVVEFN